MTSLYVPKFDYKSLTRENVNGKRQYNTPDNKRVPSVTTILSATEPQEKRDSLNQWRKRVGVEKAQAITTEAANRGTRMHSYLETYVKEGIINDRPGNPYSWASHAMAQVVIEQGLSNVREFWGVECPLFYSGIYAGTTDCCGIHEGSESILDFKQSNKEKKREWIDDYFLQLTAYGEAHNNMFGTNICKGVVLMCVKPEQDPNTFEIITPPKYQEFVISGNEYERYRVQWWKRVEQYYLMIQP